MIQHTVLLDLPETHDAGRLAEAMQTLAALVDKVPGMHTFSHGPNADYEGKSARYDYGFVTTFADREAHLAYESHPDHVMAGGTLVDMCSGGHEGIFVADIVSDSR